MATDYDKARTELDEILAGLMTEKNMKKSDKKLIANHATGISRRNTSEWDNLVSKSVITKKQTGVYDKWQDKMDAWRNTDEGKEFRKQLAIRTGIRASISNSKCVITPDGEFVSLTQAAKFYNITLGSMESRMKYHPDLYYYKDLGPGQPRTIYKFMTEYGPVKNKVDAHKMAKEHNNQSAIDINSSQYWFATMCKLFPKKYYKL